MEDKITQEFLADIDVFVKGQLENAKERIMAGYPAESDDIESAFLICLKALADDYRQLESCNKVGAAKSIYISYLRSSVILGLPVYRIDLYDERERRSLEECSCRWDFAFVYSHFEKIKQNLLKEFACQTRVKEYYLDRILYQVGNEFHEISCGLIVPMLVKLFPQIKRMRGLEKLEKCCLGEYMDQARQIVGDCSNG